MGFSKKVVTNQGGSSASSEEWDTWNETQWDLLDVTPQKLANGKEVKEVDVIGIVNFIAELGTLPQEDASMKSDKPHPKEGEENSPEELAVMDERPNNYYSWVDKWSNGTKVQERHVHWPQEPSEELVIAVDFPSIKVNYGAHPASDGVEDIKPLRIDFNGKWKQSFQRTITNEVHWKTNKFGDNDIKYKIASACGNLEEYQNDGHDLAHLVQATCNWTIKMTRNVTDKATYYSVEIKDPSAIQDIKERAGTYTKQQQLDNIDCDVEFCGILFNGGEYPIENLQQMREFWWSKAKQSVEFDKNEGTARDGEWLKGCFWDESDLGKAYKALGLGEKTSQNKPKQEQKASNPAPKKPQAKKEESPAKPKEQYNEPAMDFDDDKSAPF